MTQSRQLTGLKSKRMGEAWESVFYTVAVTQGIAITRVPDGCKQIGQSRIIRVKTPFDWILTRYGRSALIDTKSTNAASFPHSQIDVNQLKHLHLQEIHGAIAGYVIWFRSPNKVVFVRASDLKARSKQRGSITPSDGQDLGTGLGMRLELLFDHTYT